MEFVVPPADPSAFFPIAVQFSATNTYSGVKVWKIAFFIILLIYLLKKYDWKLKLVNKKECSSAQCFHMFGLWKRIRFMWTHFILTKRLFMQI
uniref:Uncharacterized protein MANES_01G123400 n=1 Tax=Rhizophora mucronata TaxID=61149 RepID=A0A2P2KJJ6_RHIMU